MFGLDVSIFDLHFSLPVNKKISRNDSEIKSSRQLCSKKCQQTVQPPTQCPSSSLFALLFVNRLAPFHKVLSAVTWVPISSLTCAKLIHISFAQDEEGNLGDN